MTTGNLRALTQSRSSSRRVFDILDTIATQNPKGAPGFPKSICVVSSALNKTFSLGNGAGCYTEQMLCPV